MAFGSGQHSLVPFWLQKASAHDSVFVTELGAQSEVVRFLGVFQEVGYRCTIFGEQGDGGAMECRRESYFGVGSALISHFICLFIKGDTRV